MRQVTDVGVAGPRPRDPAVTYVGAFDGALGGHAGGDATRSGCAVLSELDPTDVDRL